MAPKISMAATVMTTVIDDGEQQRDDNDDAVDLSASDDEDEKEMDGAGPNDPFEHRYDDEFRIIDDERDYDDTQLN